MIRNIRFLRICRTAFGLGLAIFILFASTHVQAGNIHKIGVDGLACPFCSYGVEKQLKAIPGVKSVKVSIKSGIVTVTMKDGSTLTRTRANQAVKKAGFSMRSFQ